MKKPLNPTLRIVIVSLAIVAGLVFESKAAIIYVNPADQTAGWPFPDINIDLNGGGYDFLVSLPGTDSLWFYGLLSTQLLIEGGGGDAERLTGGETIQNVLLAGYYWGGDLAPTEGNWNGQTGGYLGLRLDAGGGNWNYGWAQFSYDDLANTITLLDYAYESTVNTSILAGQGPIAAVPEPTAAGLWLVGGLLCCRYGRLRRTNNLNPKED